MTKAKTAATPVATPANDADMDKLVTDAERQFTQRDQAQIVDRIDATTRGVLTLFPFTPRNIEEGKTYPAMTGHLDTRRAKIPVSAFLKTSEEGRQFLSLSIGPKGQSHLGGAIFRQEEQNQANGLWELTPGKENERFGIVTKSVPIEGTEDYETVFSLRCYGKRKVSGAGVAYIKAEVYPERTDNGAAPAALDDCF